jgi:23S rRNA (cytosine1962-C5)-methyltransferase
MKDHAQTVAAMGDRLRKRFLHLNKWAKRSAIDYFRLYDRDVPGTPFMVDALPKHWLVWVCDSPLSAQDSGIMMTALSQVLRELNPVPVIVKDRKKSLPEQMTVTGRSGRSTVMVSEGGLLFELNLNRYLDTGLFIDHRQTRALVGKWSKGQRVLNLFAYTGSFGCYALHHGARFVTSVELNPNYADWQHRNYQHNRFNPAQYAIITADVMQFLARHRRRYDVIICDPPSISRSKRKGVAMFHVQTHGSDLIKRCWDRLNTNGKLLFSTNYKSFDFNQMELPPGAISNELTARVCSKDFEGKWQSRSWLLQSPTHSP